MDDKKREIPIEGTIEGTIEIDPSSIEIINDGSMSEPSSFSSEKQQSKPSSSSEPSFKEENNSQENGEPDGDEIVDVSDENDENTIPTGNSGDDINDEADDTAIPDTNPDTTPDNDTPFSESGDNEGENDSASTPENVSSEEKNSSAEEGKSDAVSSEDAGNTRDSSSDNTAIDENPGNESTTETSSNTSTNDSAPSEDTKIPDATNNASNDSASDNTGSNDKLDNKSNGKTDSKEDKSGKKPEGKDDKSDTKPDKKNPANSASEKASDAANNVKDSANNAKELAEKGKDLSDKASNGANNNSALNKAKMAKHASNDAKRIAKEGLKAAHDSESLRHAAEAAAAVSPWGKAVDGAIKALDHIIGRENTDKLLDKLGDQAYKSLKAGMVAGLMSLLVPLMFLALAIYIMFAPMIDALMSVKEVAINMANTAEKIANLYMNGNFADSKETFYNELDRLGKIYGKELDSTLLLATTFYTDMRNGYTTNYSIDTDTDAVDSVMDIGASANYSTVDSKKAYQNTFISLITNEIKEIENEAKGTYDESSGYMYTIGKVYRLKLLANAMFQQTFLGDKSDYSSTTIYLKDWVKTYGGTYAESIKTAINSVITGIVGGFGKGAAVSILTGIPIPYISDGSEIENLKILINCIFLGAMSISSVDFSEGTTFDKIKISYFTYKYSEENYKKYLKETYIPKNPDFKPYLSYDKDGNPTEASIDRIIDEIFEYKSYFDEIFVENDEDDSEDYSQLCIGAIDRKLASALSAPVDINTKNCIEFIGNNGYGYTADGKLHNGIELNKNSTGNVEGDKVYAVMDDGVVKASSADKTMECNGGCIEISYKYSLEGTVKKSDYDFSIVYKGLSKSSVTLKKDDKVKDRQQVGTIGTAAESEGIGIPSLYLEFRKQGGTAIDPTNMIVKCSAVVGDYPGATIIDIPQTFKQYPKYSVTCVGADGWHKSGGASNNYKCKEEATSILSPDKEVHEVWVKQGAKYKNGIAYIVVDGVERYLVAVVPREGSKGLGNAGDVLNATLKDGTILPLVVLDTKGGDKEYEWGHALGDGVGILEFEVDMDVYNSKSNVDSGWEIEWDSSSPVVKVSNNGNINDGTFDLKGGSTTSTQASGDLKLCDSMYGGGDNTPSNLCGSSAEQKIWAFLLKKGYTKESASAIIGIWMVESNLIPNVVQRGKVKVDDAGYTADVDNGTISKNEFVYNGPNGKGYGLAQWTYYTRKKGLYEYAKSKGKSIGDMQVQLEYLEKEMTTGYDWTSKKTKSRMNSQKTIEGAASIFFNEYQGVLKKNFDEKHFSKRVNNAKGVYSRLKDFNCD